MQVKDGYQFKCIHSLHYNHFLYTLLGLWELCSKFPSIIYSEFLSKSLHYFNFILLCSSFYHYSLHTYLQFKVLINNNLIIFELLEVLISHSLMLSLSVLNPKWKAACFFPHIPQSQHHHHCIFRITNIQHSKYVYMWLDLGKPIIMSHFVFWEIPFWNIEAAVALLCCIIAAQDLLYK